uniref:Glucuronosyltransferase n=1 Tax=Panagrolaimus sp. JU765 TaxID=591449 RepID=A0AC34QUH1_9BILA
MFPCGSALSHVLDIKIHFLYNSGPYMDHLAWLMGLPQPLGYVPTTCGLALSDKMSFGERILNTIESYFSMGYAENYDETNQLFQQFYGQDFPDVKNIIQKSPLVFTYVNRFIDFPRPIFAKDVYIGGLGMFDSSSEPLEEPFKSEIKKGKNGVVFFTNWAPQNQLLKHENLKLFITHGGYNSILETAQSGKPCLLIPLMFDQLRNAKVVEKNGWGKILPSTSLLETSAELVEQLNDLLTNPTYSTAAKRIKNLLETTPFSPQELLAKNVQFVLDNNGILPELEPASLQLSTIQQFNLDVFAFFFTIFVLSFGSLIIFTKFILKQLLKLSKSHHEKKTK